MSKFEVNLIVLLLAMNAGFLAVPFTQWLCETVAAAFDWLRELFRRKPKPVSHGKYEGYGLSSAMWVPFGMAVTKIAERLLMEQCARLENETRTTNGKLSK